jgi:hypothetical protein
MKMKIDYYKEKLGIDDLDIQGIVKAFIGDFPDEIVTLTELAMSEQGRRVSELKKTQGVLIDNHLFLYDVLDNSDANIKEKLITNYTKIPLGLVFDDKKILDILKT